MGVSTNGADISYCTLNGWQPKKLGKCEKLCPKIIVENSNVVYADSQGLDQVTNTEGTVATLICPPGTRLIGKGTVECVDGKWSEEKIGECKTLSMLMLSIPKGSKTKISDCSHLDTIDNGRLTYFNAKNEPTNPLVAKITPGTTVRLTCDSGRSLKGAGESMCHTSETWQPEIGVCE